MRLIGEGKVMGYIIKILCDNILFLAFPWIMNLQLCKREREVAHHLLASRKKCKSKMLGRMGFVRSRKALKRKFWMFSIVLLFLKLKEDVHVNILRVESRRLKEVALSEVLGKGQHFPLPGLICLGRLSPLCLSNCPAVSASLCSFSLLFPLLCSQSSATLA